MRDKFVVTPDSFTQEQWCEMYVTVVNEYQNLKNTLKDREEYCDKLEEDRENILIENKKQKEVLNKIKKNNQRIIDYGFDYDGFNNVEDLKKLIDMLVDYARKNNELLEEIE